MVADPRSALVLFSGGQDSTVCLAHALERYAHVETIGFDYGQRHLVELESRLHVRAAAAGAVRPLGRQARPGPRRRPVAARPSSSDTALTSEREIEMNAGGLPNTFVPVRNLLFFTVAASVADRRGLSVLIGGMCETDYLRLPRLPRQHPQVAAGRDQPRPRQVDDDRDAADVARQGRHLGDDRGARRREADRAGRSSTPTPAISATASTATPGAGAAACARHATCGARDTTPGSPAEAAPPRLAPAGPEGRDDVHPGRRRDRRRAARLLDGRRLQPDGEPAQRPGRALRRDRRALPLPPCADRAAGRAAGDGARPAPGRASTRSTPPAGRPTRRARMRRPGRRWRAR